MLIFPDDVCGFGMAGLDCHLFPTEFIVLWGFRGTAAAELLLVLLELFQGIFPIVYVGEHDVVLDSFFLGVIFVED